MPRSTRRGFLQAVAAGTTALAWTIPARAQRGLEQFLLPAPPCKDDLTPPVPTGPEYRPGAPVRPSLVEAGERGPTMTLSGYVSGLTCGRVKGARLEFWQADAAGRLDMTGYRYRGVVMSEADGRYRIETVVPGQVGGRARRIWVRVQPPGKPALPTVLFFPDDEAAAKDRAFKPQLVMTRAGSGAVPAFTFDFLLDL